MSEAEETPTAVSSRPAGKLRSQHSSVGALQEVVASATTLVQGTDYAGVSVLSRNNQFESPAYTNDLVRQIDLLQQETGEGPCLEAMDDDEEFLIITDMEREERWPRFARRAHQLGIRSMLSCRLLTEHGTRGALNLHAREAGAFNETAAETAAVFAVHASSVLTQVLLIESLNTAVQSRKHIGEATGILMERHGIPSEEAFSMLVRASQNSNTKLREIAERLVATRIFPPPSGTP